MIFFLKKNRVAVQGVAMASPFLLGFDTLNRGSWCHLTVGPSKSMDRMHDTVFSYVYICQRSKDAFHAILSISTNAGK
jgi:hypothetical protein